jgi:RNA-splicing ligase RtcB
MEQIRELLDNPLFRGAKMRIMPDVHAGKGIVIGYTCRVEDFVNPEHVGLDIGCGIDTEIFDRPLPEKDYALFEHRLRKEVPMGFDIHKDRQFEMKPFLKFMRQELNRAYQSSGGRIDIIEWNRIASAKGGYLLGNELRAYLTDMVITQAYAKYNRKLILDKAAEIMHKICGGKVDGIINTVHNYVDFRDMVLRKGAIRSYEGELMVMPFNMRDGIAICQGLSNEDWNWSAPHGSGRLMSRTQAHRQLQMKGYKEEMQGVYSTSICPETIDESPSAYKPTEDILQAITPTCKVLYRLRSKINLKGK